LVKTGKDPLQLLKNLEMFTRLALNLGAIPWIGTPVMILLNFLTGGEGPKKLMDFTRQCIKKRLDKTSKEKEQSGERRDMLYVFGPSSS
jgi:hypothetical protein